MSDVRVPARIATPPHPPEQPGAREAKLSRRFLWWLPAAPFVGFALAGRVLKLTDGDWELWKSALLGALMMAPFAVGVYFGLLSVLKGCRGGWVGAAGNLILAVVAIGMPVVESLTG